MKKLGWMLKRTLINIRQRCYNPKDPGYRNYGGRGIKVCKEWLDDPGAFVTWALNAGFKPGLMIDRADNDGDYSPKNCRWLTPMGSSQNRRGLTTNWARGTRICYSCKIEKPLSEFHRDRRAPGGRSYLCKKCAIERTRERRRLKKRDLAEELAGELKGGD